ncbi:glycosyltransferase family 32 protein [Sharpea azabuensis]|uniref:glycosyltransferase family 32 protein n=1 Tax=Sharpea azabuensis TaxID=322505 RepID=UPI0015695DBE|nr:glycosyltransferase [Sharpea azabuensis]
MIPKVIHYCWFGRNEKSDLIKRCIESWKKYCPEYQIIEWNEDNFDVNTCEYTRKAYFAKKWAFVSDYARLKIIFENGGIYLDTDVELKQGLDSCLNYGAWFAQDDIRYINTGLGFGACKGNFLLKKMLDIRSSRSFDMTICNVIDTPIIKEYLDYKQSRQSQIIKNTLLIGMNDYSAYAKHWEGNSWKDEESKQFQIRRRGKNWKFKRFLRNPELMNWLERNGETKFSKLYVFLTYDLLDNGLAYFLKRVWKRQNRN